MSKSCETCQACTQPIQWGERVIAVRYGEIRLTSHPHTRVSKGREDFFHARCVGNAAFVSEVEGVQDD